MLKRNFTREELPQLKFILNKYFQTHVQVVNDNDIEIGQLVSTWVISTLQQLVNVNTPFNLHIKEEVLEVLKVCLHFKNCHWSISDSILYKQFLQFASEFSPVEDEKTEPENADTTAPEKVKNFKTHREKK